MDPLPQEHPQEHPQQQIQFEEMPLAVYREVMAHLSQVTGVTTGLLPPASDRPFAYEHSQVGGLWLGFDDTATSASRARVEQILAYYGQRYGSFQVRS